MASQKSSRYIIKVFLYEIEPVIWRRFSVPAESTFAQLHEYIQRAMGWDNEKLHEFRHGKGKRLTDVIAKPGPEFPPGDYFQDETELSLESFVGRRRPPVRLLYRYDFADEWIHEVVIEKREENTLGEAVLLLEGERACPPEDTGGAWAYRQAAQGIVDWLVDDYDPEHFEIGDENLRS